MRDALGGREQACQVGEGRGDGLAECVDQTPGQGARSGHADLLPEDHAQRDLEAVEAIRHAHAGHAGQGAQGGVDGQRVGIQVQALAQALHHGAQGGCQRGRDNGFDLVPLGQEAQRQPARAGLALVREGEGAPQAARSAVHRLDAGHRTRSEEADHTGDVIRWPVG